MHSTARASDSGVVRIVNLTSDGHTYAPKEGINFNDISLPGSHAMVRYGQSKLANILHAAELHRRCGPSSHTHDIRAEDPAALESGPAQALEQQESPPTIERAGKMDVSSPTSGHIWTAAVHPGHIKTNLSSAEQEMLPGIVVPSSVLRPIANAMRCLGILAPVEQGAWSTLYAIASPDFSVKNSGVYIVPYAQVGTPSKQAKDKILAARLWAWTKEEMQGKGLLNDI